MPAALLGPVASPTEPTGTGGRACKFWNRTEIVRNNRTQTLLRVPSYCPGTLVPDGSWRIFSEHAHVRRPPSEHERDSDANYTKRLVRQRFELYKESKRKQPLASLLLTCKHTAERGDAHDTWRGTIVRPRSVAVAALGLRRVCAASVANAYARGWWRRRTSGHADRRAVTR